MTRRMVLLLVEDNPEDVLLIQRAIRKSDFDVRLEVVDDGEKAMDYLVRVGESHDTPRPTVIMMDINLPRIGGLEVLARVKEDRQLRLIPVVVFTISDREEDMVKAYDSGAAAFFTKPTNADEYIRLLREIRDYWLDAKTPTGS